MKQIFFNFFNFPSSKNPRTIKRLFTPLYFFLLPFTTRLQVFTPFYYKYNYSSVTGA